jgi:hypothetical protein
MATAKPSSSVRAGAMPEFNKNKSKYVNYNQFFSPDAEKRNAFR